MREELLKKGLEKFKENNYLGMEIIPTGVGKSWIFCQCLLELYNYGYSKILYTCDNTDLRDVDFKKELVKWGCEHIIPFIEFKCYQSAYKKENETYDVLLMDECDYAITPSYIKLLQNNKFKHIIALSATIADSKRKVIEKYLPILMEIKMEEIEGKGIVNEADVYVCNFRLNEKENAKYLNFNLRFKRLINSGANGKAAEFLQRSRKMFLGNLETSVVKTKILKNRILNSSDENKILIFCNYSEQADKISNYTYHTLNNCIDNLNKFDSGEVRELVVIGKIDRGKNLQNVNYSIMESIHNSGSKNQQKTGRLRRLPIEKKCVIIFMCPWYKDLYGNWKPTIIKKYIEESTKDLGFKFKQFNL